MSELNKDINKTKYVAKSLSRGTHKAYETMVVNAIYARLNNPEIEIKTQQFINTKNKDYSDYIKKRRYIDLFFPQIQLAVEVDEGYHDNPYQMTLDKTRENSINQTILESTIIEDENRPIQFERVRITSNGELLDLSQINIQIDRIVDIINKKISTLKDLKWSLDTASKIKEIQARGYLQRGDSFVYMKDILLVFGKVVKGYQHCTWENVWSPTLTVSESDKSQWVNTISSDLNFIFEGNKDEQKKGPKDADYYIEKDSSRYVFLKYKNVLGITCRKFLGVYKINPDNKYDTEKHAVIWTLVSTTCNLNN